MVPGPFLFYLYPLSGAHLNWLHERNHPYLSWKLLYHHKLKGELKQTDISLYRTNIVFIRLYIFVSEWPQKGADLNSTPCISVPQYTCNKPFPKKSYSNISTLWMWNCVLKPRSILWRKREFKRKNCSWGNLRISGNSGLLYIACPGKIKYFVWYDMPTKETFWVPLLTVVNRQKVIALLLSFQMSIWRICFSSLIPLKTPGLGQVGKTLEKRVKNGNNRKLLFLCRLFHKLV